MRFTLIGENLGDYVLSDASAINRIYEYIPPINGVKQGDYAPIIQLTAPSKIQVGGINGKYHPSDKTLIGFEVAGSNNDLNLFSDLDNTDNTGFAGKLSINQTLLKVTEIRKLDAFATVDFINENFKTIERLYTVEFNRDWNINNPIGNQRYIVGGL